MSYSISYKGTRGNGISVSKTISGFNTDIASDSTAANTFARNFEKLYDNGSITSVTSTEKTEFDTTNN